MLSDFSQGEGATAWTFHAQTAASGVCRYTILIFLLGCASPLPLDDTGTTTIVLVWLEDGAAPLAVVSRVTVGALPFGSVVVAEEPAEVLASATVDDAAAAVLVEATELELVVVTLVEVAGSTLGFTGVLSILPMATAPLMSAN